MVFDQALSPRLGQRTQVESTYVQSFSGDEIPEAAWEGMLIYRNETQALQRFNGNAWEDVVGGSAGTLTFVGPTPPLSQTIGDVWFDSSDSNHMYRAASIGADTIGPGEWEDMQGSPPIPGAKTFRQDAAPAVASEGDLWFETDNKNKQYYYHAGFWVTVQDGTISDAQSTATAAQGTANTANSTANSANTLAGTANTAAGNAQSTANTANSTANAALTTANSRNKTYSQTTPPPGTSYVEGDIWYDSDDGYKSYRWTSGAWVNVQDTAIATAQAAAVGAQGTATNANNTASAASTTANQALTAANGKNRTYYQTAAPTGGTYVDGDLWFDTDDANKLYRYTSGSWVSAQDTGIAAAQGTANAAQSAATGAQTTADGKNKSYYQGTAPTGGLVAGDLWFDTANGFKAYRYSGSAWVTVQDTSIATAQSTASTANTNANTALTTANGKNKSYYQTTAPGASGLVVGDLWFDTANGYKAYRWDGAAWQSVQDTSIATAQSTANTANTNAGAAQTTANNALTTANGKNKIFVQSATPTATATGDQWIDSGNGNLLKVWDGSAWVVRQDTAIGTAQSSANNALTTANGKNKIFVASVAPTATAVGDQWIDTANSNVIKVWDGSAWVNRQDGGISSAQTAATNAQNTANTANTAAGNAQTTANTANTTANSALTTANGKNKIFVQSATPTATAAGDTWIDTGNGNVLKTWSGSAWVNSQDAAIAAAQSTANTANGTANSALTSANGKNKTYYQTAQPSGGTYVDGDLWFDSDDGFKPYRYNGSTWVVVQDSTIATAQSTANTANTTANNALTSANGKNRVYYQTAQPTGGTYIDGDTWYDTDDGYQMYVRSGSSWVASKLGTNAIANLAITAALIADATITDAKVGSLDAAKITTGTLNALRIGAGSITSTHIATDTITAGNIAANAITSSELNAGAVTAGKIATDTITANEIAAGAITSSELAAGAVIAGKIAAGIITANEIAGSTITAAQIAADTITATQIAASAITSSELAAGAVIAGKIAAGVVTATEIAGQTITAAQIAAGTITAANIATGTITATQIATDTITASQIAANAITASELNTGAVTAGKIAAGVVTATEIATGTITATQIAGQTITGAKIAADTITSTEIAANAITASELNAGAVTAGKIAANAVTATELAANAVTAGKINAGAVTAGTIAANAVDASAINAGAVTVGKIAAGAVTAEKLSIGAYASTLVPNAQFEELDTAGTWAAGWSTLTGTGYASAVYALETTNMISGSRSIKMTAAASNSAGTYGRIVPIAPADLFYVSAMVRSDAASTGTVQVGLWFYDKTTTFLSGVTQAGDVTTTATYLQCQGQAPLGAAYVVPVLLTTSTTATYWDNVEMGQQINAVKIADGAITAKAISSDYVYTKALVSENLASDMVVAGRFITAPLGSTGQRVELSGTDGLQAFDENGTLKTYLATGGSAPSKIGGQGDLDSLNVYGSTTLNAAGAAAGASTVVNQGTDLRLGNGVQAPSVPPTITTGIAIQSLTGALGAKHIGLVASAGTLYTLYDDDKDVWLCGFSNSTFALTSQVKLAGTSTGWNNRQAVGGLALISGNWYVLYKNSGGYWYVYTFNASGQPVVPAGAPSSIVGPMDQNVGSDYVVGMYGYLNGTVPTLWFGQCVTNGNLWLFEYDARTFGANGAGQIGADHGPVLNWARDVGGMYLATATTSDLTATRMMMTGRTNPTAQPYQTLAVDLSTYTNDNARAFKGNITTGITYDNGRFWTLRRDSAQLYKYSNLRAETAGDTFTFGCKATYALGSGPTSETAPGPEAIDTGATKRGTFTATMSQLPVGTDRARFHIRVGTGVGTNAPATSQPVAAPFLSVTFATLGTSGTTPPATPSSGNFPAGTPSRVVQGTSTLLGGETDGRSYGTFTTGDIKTVAYTCPGGATPIEAGGTWLLCDGSSFSSNTWPALAAKLGDTYGTHSGTTYYLPDTARRVMRGTDLTGGASQQVGANDGLTANLRALAHSHGIAASDLNHTHNVSGVTIGGTGSAHTNAAGSLNNTVATNTTIGGTANRATNPITGDTGTTGSSHTHNITGPVDASTGMGAHTHGGSTDANAGNQALPYISFNVLIKT